MNKKHFIMPLLAMAVTVGGMAQTDQNQDIIIHRKGNPQQKTTIVIDGKNITVNGKPVDQWKDGSVELRQIDSTDKSFTITDLKQQLQQMFQNGTPPSGGTQFFRRFMQPIAPMATNKAQLGVMTQTPTNESGAAIKEVKPGASAEKAGLQKGDIIQKVDDTPIKNMEDLYKTIGKYQPGDTVTISFKRNGADKTTKAILDKNTGGLNGNPQMEELYDFKMPPIYDMPDNDFGNMNNKPMLGVQIEELSDNSGVKINNINPNSPAEKAGLAQGDIVTAIDGTTIKNIEDIKEKLSNKKAGDSINLTYLRNGKKHNTVVVFPKPIKKATL